MEKPVTPATERLVASDIRHRLVHNGRVDSAEEAARRRGISLEQLVKTLVVRVEEGRYVLVLVPGNAGLDYKKLRSHLGVNRLTMPSPDEALEATGYPRGAITPIEAGGWPVILDTRLADQEEISLGSGTHGWAIHLSPEDLITLTGAEVADIAG